MGNHGHRTPTTTGAPLNVNVIIVKYAGPDPGLIKWVNYGSRTIIPEYDTKSSTTFGHANAAGAISTGATAYFDTPVFNGQPTATIETFSSAGGTPILFNTDGSRINGITGTVRQKPEITSVDGGDNTFFGGDFEGNGKPNFFGTSASAPHAAAVAALMKQKVPAITRNTILSTLQSTALDMDDPSTAGFDTGFDFGTGFGFIQADRALQAILPSFAFPDRFGQSKRDSDQGHHHPVGDRIGRNDPLQLYLLGTRYHHPIAQ